MPVSLETGQNLAGNSAECHITERLSPASRPDRYSETKDLAASNVTLSLDRDICFVRILRPINDSPAKVLARSSETTGKVARKQEEQRKSTRG